MTEKTVCGIMEIWIHPVTMVDWASKLDAFLQFNDAEVLQDKGKVTAAVVKAFAESEFEQYRVIQDALVWKKCKNKNRRMNDL